MFRILTCLGFLILMLASPTLSTAQVALDQSVEDPQPLIEVAPPATTDKQIESRISSIFDKIDSIKNVDVTVDSGVVTLSGEVVNEAAAQDAKNIAIRTEGVVTVTDNINRTLDVRGNVTPFVQALQENSQKLFRALPLIIIALVIFLIFVAIGGWLARRKRLWRKIAPSIFLAEILSQITRLIFWTLGAVVALNLVGASGLVTTILGGAGVVGIAIGFAVRDSLENYISSIMLSLRQPFRAKDHVVINEHEGIVVRLTSRATILMTMEGNHLRIPNATVFKGIILNYTTNPERRFDFELGVDANDDPIAAINVGMDALETQGFVLDAPEPNAVIRSVGDSNIVLKFYGWVDQSVTSFGKARSQAIRTVKAALEENGFTLPEPIYRIRVDGDVPKFTGKVAKVTPKPPVSPQAQDTDIDVSKDTHLEELVEEELEEESKNDLLDEAKPTE